MRDICLALAFIAAATVHPLAALSVAVVALLMVLAC